MGLVRTSQQDCIELTAGRMSEFGAELILQNRELLDCVDGDIDVGTGHVLQVIVCALNHEIVVARPLSPNCRAVSDTYSTRAGNTCAGQRQVIHAGGLWICRERQVCDHLREVCVRHLGCRCVDERNRVGHIDCGGRTWDRQHDIRRCGFVQFNLDVIQSRGCESRSRRSDAIRADLQIVKAVNAAHVGCRCCFHSRRNTLSFDFRVRYCRTGRIENRTHQVPVLRLTERILRAREGTQEAQNGA